MALQRPSKLADFLSELEISGAMMSNGQYLMGGKQWRSAKLEEGLEDPMMGMKSGLYLYNLDLLKESRCLKMRGDANMS